MKAPKQARSASTLQAIVKTAKELLQTQRWQDISLRQIADLAEISQGTLYARFPTKSELLNFLHQEFCEAEAAKMQSLFETALASSEPFPHLLRQAIEFYIQNLKETRSMARAFTQAAASDDQVRRRQTTYSKRAMEMVVAVARQKLGKQFSPAMENSMKTSLHLVLGTARDSFDSSLNYPLEAQLQDKELVDALVETCLKVLDISEGQNS